MFKFESSDRSTACIGPDATFVLTYFMAEFIEANESCISRFIDETEHDKEVVFGLEEINQFMPKLNTQRKTFNELFRAGLEQDLKGVDLREFLGASSTLDCLETYMMYRHALADNRLIV